MPKQHSQWAAVRAMHTQVENKAMITLMGMVTGIAADGQLHDLEVQLLNSWLKEHHSVTSHWPGGLIAHQVRQVLADCVITDDERVHLLAVLSELANTDFANTGSAASEPLQLPIDDSVPLQLMHASVVHTGAFIFGTRAACERLSMAMGAVCVDNVNTRTNVLIIGTRVTPEWKFETYGRKILRGMELKASGHPIAIVSERKWIAHATSLGHVQPSA